jgi:hypothetical protein
MTAKTANGFVNRLWAGKTDALRRWPAIRMQIDRFRTEVIRG